MRRLPLLLILLLCAQVTNAAASGPAPVVKLLLLPPVSNLAKPVLKTLDEKLAAELAARFEVVVLAGAARAAAYKPPQLKALERCSKPACRQVPMLKSEAGWLVVPRLAGTKKATKVVLALFDASGEPLGEGQCEGEMDALDLTPALEALAAHLPAKAARSSDTPTPTGPTRASQPPTGAAGERPGWLGVRYAEVTAEVAARLHLTEPRGALVTLVRDGGAAARAGIRLDDVVMTFDGVPVANDKELGRRLEQTSVGQHVFLLIQRAGESMEIEVELGPRVTP